MTELPKGWSKVQLSEICSINPRIDKTALDLNSFVSFVPMPAVEAETGKIDISETRKFETVRKSYTSFQTGDVLFAKITPCMENGKMAVVPELSSTYGFGSTSFHVIRPYAGVDSGFIYYTVASKTFRFYAEHNMVGSVGQRYVPAAILEKHEIGLPPKSEQCRIANKVEALFAEIDKGVESLQAAKKAIELYRQSLLKYAFEGHLTAEWRTRNADKLESPDTLLDRIHKEREKQYKLSLEDWKQAVAKWEKSSGKSKKPTKPKQLPGLSVLPVPSYMPSEWLVVTLASLGRIQTGTTPAKEKREQSGSIVPFFKPTDLDAGINVRKSRECLSEASVMPSRYFIAGTILVTCIGATIGKTGMAMVNGTCNQQINFLEPYLPINSKFIYYQIIHPQFQEQIKNNASSTTLPILNKGKFALLHTNICSPVEQAKIVQILDTYLEAADRLDKEIDTNLARADVLRQSILKKAFTGELVPQDPNDEPASALLEQIRAERTDALVVKRKKRAVMKA